MAGAKLTIFFGAHVQYDMNFGSCSSVAKLLSAQVAGTRLDPRLFPQHECRGALVVETTHWDDWEVFTLETLEDKVAVDGYGWIVWILGHKNS